MSDLVGNPEDRFSRVEAQYMTIISNISKTAWQIKAKLCGACLERGNESLHEWSRSHDQDDRHDYK